MKRISIYFIAIVLLSSCSSTDSLKVSTIEQDTELTKIKLGPGVGVGPRPLIVEVYKISKGDRAFIEIKDNKIRIDPIVTPAPLNTYSHTLNYGLLNSESYSLPYEFEYDGLFAKLRAGNTVPVFTHIYKVHYPFDQGFFIGEKFKYSQSSENFQTITIPFKLRPGIDTFSYQLTTGVNVGFSYAFKRIKKTYEPVSINKTSRLIGYRENEFEYGFAPFIGLTTVGLKESNTRGAVAADKTVFGTSLGILLSGGINKFDVGIAFGIDHAFGKNSGDWIYQDEPWFGLVLGIDLVK